MMAQILSTTTCPWMLREFIVDNVFGLGLLPFLAHFVLVGFLFFDYLSFGTHYVLFYFTILPYILSILNGSLMFVLFTIQLANFH